MLWPIRWLLGQVLKRQASRQRAHFHALTTRPRETQHKNLFDMLSRERDTAFGRDHGFAQIKTIADYRRHLPISNYEYFAPYIERVRNGDFEAMFHRQKVLMFAMTSGTTASRKYVPVTKRFLDDYRRGWLIWGMHMFEDHRELWFRTMVQFGSDHDEFRSKADIPCGSISGLTVRMQKYIVRKTYCLPPGATKLKEIQAKYYLAWRLGLMRDVAVMVTANPSTLVSWARFGEENAASIIRDVNDGSIDPRFPMPRDITTDERKRLSANPQRAKELEAILKESGGFKPRDVWPGLGMLCNWTGGSVGAYMRHYPQHFGETGIRDIGLVASEGRMTIPVEDGTAGGILEISSSYFEFVPVDEIDKPNPTVLESHELIEGHDYYILLTTASGLYRYNIYDVVRCLGFREKTPVLEFLNKGANFSNITGEKISEFQVVRAVQNASRDLGVDLTAYSLAPCWDDQMPFYSLFVENGDLDRQSGLHERLAIEVEHRLQDQNSEYQSKRETERLGPVRVHRLPTGFWKEWDTARLRRNGGSAEQYKHPCLIPDVEFINQVTAKPTN